MAEFNWPSITVGSSPISFVKDAIVTTVTEDTVVPANTEALPVNVTKSVLPTGAATEATLATLALDTTLTQVGNDVVLLQGLVTDVITNTTGLDLLAKNSGAVDANTLRTKLANEDTAKVDAIKTSVDTVNTNVGTLNTTTGTVKTSVDAVKTSVDTVNTSVGTLNTTTGTVKTSVDTLNTTTGTVKTSVDTVNTSVGTVNTSIGTMSGKLPATLGQKAMAASLSVAIASDQGSLSVAEAVPAALTVKQAAVSVGTSAVRITTDGLAVSTTRRRLRFQPDANATGSFWYGSSSVTSSGATRGCQIFPGQTEEFVNDANEYYVISDTAAQTVFVLEVE